MSKHAICHIEWGSTNLDRSKTFYGGLFDWSFTPFGEEYLMFKAPEFTGGAFMKLAEVKATNSPTVYIQVNEIEPYLARAAKLGGAVAVAKTEIPTVGWYAHLKDPDGNIVGLFQSGPRG